MPGYQYLFPLTGSEIHLGAFYEPATLYDCRGSYFQFGGNKLRQLDIRDEASQLIPPWKCYDELRPGTLVLVKASLHIYAFTDNVGAVKRKVSNAYFLLSRPSITPSI
jgi:hypothetical protein